MSEKEEALESEILEQLKSFIPKSYEMAEKSIQYDENRYSEMYRLGALETLIENLIDQIDTGLIRINAQKRLIKE